MLLVRVLEERAHACIGEQTLHEAVHQRGQAALATERLVQAVVGRARRCGLGEGTGAHQQRGGQGEVTNEVVHAKAFHQKPICADR